MVTSMLLYCLLICQIPAYIMSLLVISKENLRSIVEVKAVLSDMDGTLLNSHHAVSHSSLETIKRLREENVLFFPATGRTRKSAIDAAGQSFVELFGNNLESIPGVFSQGLVVYGKNGHLIYERFIDENALAISEDFFSKENMAIVAYAGDRIFCQKRSPQALKVCDYGDPEPEEFPSGLKNLLQSGISVNKLIVLAEQETLVNVRPQAEELLKGKATITTAVPGMMEILPYGASKGEGVRILLEHFSISPENVIAFGDGENDIEMLKYVGVGVVMENGKPELKKGADLSTLSNDDDGVAFGINIILESVKNCKVSA